MHLIGGKILIDSRVGVASSADNIIRSASYAMHVSISMHAHQITKQTSFITLIISCGTYQQANSVSKVHNAMNHSQGVRNYSYSTSEIFREISKSLLKS